MDPSMIEPIKQIGEQGPMTIAGIVAAVAVGLGLAAKQWNERGKRASAERVVLAHDGVSRVAAVSVEAAFQIQGTMIEDLRAQLREIAQTVAGLQTQLSEAVNNNTRLVKRVGILEHHMRAAGLTIPPDHAL